MTGQDAVKSADEFHKKLSLTGVVLTKMDGDARGGAALSIRQVTGQPIKFIGSAKSMMRWSLSILTESCRAFSAWATFCR